MPLYLKKGDITNIRCDAIVNATDGCLSGSGGVDRRIHQLAGTEMDEECRQLGSCAVGSAVITGAYRLPARYVIHTVGPVWSGSDEDNVTLARCYRSCLELARENGCTCVAFPLISAGTFGFPEDEALCLAKTCIEAFLEDCDLTVYLVAYREHTYDLGERIFGGIIPVPSARKASAAPSFAKRRPGNVPERREKTRKSDEALPSVFMDREEKAAFGAVLSECASVSSLSDRLCELDESFAEMLLRKIEQSGMTNAECYNRALVNKSVFSKIKNNPDYRPTKSTVAGFVIALKLPMREAREMLSKAGYSLSRSSRFDIILEWFIENGNYNVYDINEVLLDYDQPLIGFVS